VVSESYSEPFGSARAGKKDVRRIHMLYWAAVFFIIALVAAVFGFTGIEIASAGVAKVLFLIFLVLFVFSLIRGVARRV
jgi:uncharacterized membrane protein YtjA (UPF0391 family)